MHNDHTPACGQGRGGASAGRLVGREKVRPVRAPLAHRSRVGYRSGGEQRLRVLLARLLADACGRPGLHDPHGVVGPIERVAAHAGLDGRLTGVAVVDTPVLALGENPGETAERASTAGGELVRQGATVLVLGCMSMAFLDLGPVLEAKLGVPVVNPVHAALAVAEGRARYRMRHSKAAYPVPRKVASGSRLSSLLGGHGVSR